jgi:hypothetical protein
MSKGSGQGSSEQVREVALEKYVQPALRAGKKQFSVPVKDLIRDLVSQGFPRGNTPQVCTALRKKEFLRAHGIEIEAVDGPPSKMSTTVVFRYRVASSDVRPGPSRPESENEQTDLSSETPEQWAHRMTGKLYGLMKDEMAAFGGGEAFLRWVRSEDEDEAA